MEASTKIETFEPESESTDRQAAHQEEIQRYTSSRLNKEEIYYGNLICLWKKKNVEGYWLLVGPDCNPRLTRPPDPDRAGAFHDLLPSVDRFVRGKQTVRNRHDWSLPSPHLPHNQAPHFGPGSSCGKRRRARRAHRIQRCGEHGRTVLHSVRYSEVVRSLALLPLRRVHYRHGPPLSLEQ